MRRVRFTHGAQLRPDALLHRPVDGDVAPHGVHEFTGDSAERLFAEHLDRAVVYLQGVIEGELLV